MNESVPLPLSPVDLNSTMLKLNATGIPAHSVVRGISPGNQYNSAREDRIDLFVVGIENDNMVDSMEMLKRPSVLRDFTTDSNAPQCYDQLVLWITQQYNLATYFSTVDSSLASPTSTQSDSALSRVALRDITLDKSSCNNCLTIAKIEGHLLVTFISINKMGMVYDNNNEVKHINTNSLNLRWTSTNNKKQAEEDSQPLLVDSLHRADDEICGNESDTIQEKEE